MDIIKEISVEWSDEALRIIKQYVGQDVDLDLPKGAHLYRIFIAKPGKIIVSNGNCIGCCWEEYNNFYYLNAEVKECKYYTCTNGEGEVQRCLVELKTPSILIEEYEYYEDDRKYTYIVDIYIVPVPKEEES